MKQSDFRNITSSRFLPVFVALFALAGCGDDAPTEKAIVDASPWKQTAADEKVYRILDIPLRKLHEETDDYLGIVFEDLFKFYRIYHDKEDADPSLRGQVILGETHFTARPVHQYLHAIQIQITPQQEAWIRAKGIQRQDAIRARIRFSGIAPGSALAFDLLEILDTQKE